MEIQYKRIRLRKPTTEYDHQLQVTWRNSELAKLFFYTEDEITMESHMLWYEKLLQDPNQLFFMIDIITEPDSPNKPLKKSIPIGMTSLDKINHKYHRAEYSRLMIGDENYLHRGIAAEAEYALMYFSFHYLKLNRVYGELLHYNQNVLSLHKKMGFKEEGRLCEHVFKRGKFEDVIMIGLLAKDFDMLHRNTFGVFKVKIEE